MTKKKTSLKRLLRKPRNHKMTSAPQIDPLIPVVVQMLNNTEENELSCDELFDLIDHYAELSIQDENVEALYPLIRLHLDRCRDCLEEYQALRRILESVSH